MDSSLHRGTGSPGTWLLYTKLNHAGPPLPTAQMACSLCARAEIVRDTIVVHTGFLALNHAELPLLTAQMASSLRARAATSGTWLASFTHCTDGQQLACKGSDIRDMIEQEASRGVPLKKEQ
eukprot:1148196-Pelagomonas_calceolata.AAC.5